MSGREPYRQILPELELSIERGTEAVPDDGYFYLIRSSEQVGRYRSLKAAQTAWREIIDASGWKPGTRQLDPIDVMRREQTERWARNRAG